MAFVETYISKVGVQSGNAMKIVLYNLLHKRYQWANDTEFAGKLAAAVANYLFCDEPTGDAQSFAKINHALIESSAKDLSSEESLCRALTCAVYNSCYGRYVDSGRKIGLLVHPFLGFVRGLQEVINAKERPAFLESFYPKVGYENVKPLLNLWLLGLYRALPYTPDSKLMMDEIARFGKSVEYRDATSAGAV
ncbi:MAG: hypothetical protein WA628_19850 [Terriglobales bacterium]